MKTPIIFSTHPWKLRPLKHGMSETEREVDLLEEDIVVWVGEEYLKDKTWVLSATRFKEHAA